MGARRAAAAGLLCLLWHLASSKNGQPRCHTDFATELVCCWEVDAITNCTTEFNLLYRASFARQSRECVPENKQGPGAASHCICTIPGQRYRLISYDLVLAKRESGAKVWNVTLEMDSVVKPRPLINLTIEKKKEDRSFSLTWKRDYNSSNSLYDAVAKYEVAYWPKDHKEREVVVPEASSHHAIFADDLHSGSAYEASVRYGLILWGKTWSEWSATCEWLNDFEPSPGKGSWTFIPWLCILIIALILSCYLCFLWVKKWRDGIPSPAKSKMVEDMTVRKLFSVFSKVETAAECKTAPCDSRRWPFQSKDGAGLPHPPVSVNREPFLIPEVSLIEASLTTCSSAGDVKLGSPEEEEEETDHIPHEDALAGLFRDLLHGALSPGDPAPPATSAHSCTAPEKRDSPEGFPQPVYQGCQAVPAALEGSGPQPRVGQGPSSPEVRADRLLRLENSSAAPSSTVIPGGASPRAGDRSGSSSAAPGYKSFGSLEAQAGSSFSQAWRWWLYLPQDDQAQAQSSPGPCLLPPGAEPPRGTSGRFPAGHSSLPLYGAATEMWLLPPQQGVALEASALQGPGRPGSLPGPKASLCSGYRSFSCALQNSISPQGFCLELGSPYKPFLSSAPLDPGLEVAQPGQMHPGDGWGQTFDQEKTQHSDILPGKGAGQVPVLRTSVPLRC